MTKGGRGMWWCGNCGYEIPNRGRCRDCGGRLLPSPLPELEPGEDEVRYRLREWDDELVARLIGALIGGDVLHRFDDDDLIFLATERPKVDDLVIGVLSDPAIRSRAASTEKRPEEVPGMLTLRHHSNLTRPGNRFPLGNGPTTVRCRRGRRPRALGRGVASDLSSTVA
jgi:hypothetical protein